LAVASTRPFDGASAVRINAPVVVTFNRPAQAASITADATATCTGSVQVSSDNFATCVAMAGGASAAAGNSSFVLTPAALLSPSTSYRVRVTSGALDADGVALSSA